MKPSKLAPDGLEILEPEECRRLLGRGGVGRLALPGEGVPDLRPVNFVLHDEVVVIRTGEGRILDAARRGLAAAFEIDGVDLVEHDGWSVLVTGKISVRTDDEANRALPLRAWAPQPKDCFVEIAIESIEGRRVLRPGFLP